MGPVAVLWIARYLYDRPFRDTAMAAGRIKPPDSMMLFSAECFALPAGSLLLPCPSLLTYSIEQDARRIAASLELLKTDFKNGGGANS